MWDYTFEQLIECHSINLLSAKSQHQLTGLFMLPFLPSPLIYFLTSSKLASAHNRLLLARFTQGLQVLNHIRSCPIIQKIHFSTSRSWALPCAIKPCLLASYHTGITLPHLTAHFVSTQKEDHTPCGPLLLHTAQSRYGVTWLRVCLYTGMSNSIYSPFPSAFKFDRPLPFNHSVICTWKS